MGADSQHSRMGTFCISDPPYFSTTCDKNLGSTVVDQRAGQFRATITIRHDYAGTGFYDFGGPTVRVHGL